MAGTRAPFASLAALAAVASAHAQEQPQPSAVETAKRDLQSLPTTQRTIEGTQSKSLFSNGPAIPSLSVGTPGSGTPSPQTKDVTVPAKTGGWLVDGVNQLEADAQSQADSRASAGAGDEGRMQGGNGTAATTNPFAGYLTQWLTPGDQALLNVDRARHSSSSTAPWETPRTEFAPALDTRALGGPSSQMELPGLDLFTQNQPTANPYLTGDMPAEVARAPLDTPIPSREASNTLAPMETGQSANPLSPVAPRVEQAQAAPSAPPTSRLVDDRKYFPQLRRF
jgi:hypothetical protein